MSLIELNEENFHEEINNLETPILVDFWAPWCGPCQQLTPILRSLSDQFGKKLVFSELNVQDNQKIAQEFGIRGIPCLVVFSKGKEVERIVGFSDEATLRSKLDIILSKI